MANTNRAEKIREAIDLAAACALSRMDEKGETLAAAIETTEDLTPAGMTPKTFAARVARALGGKL